MEGMEGHNAYEPETAVDILITSSLNFTLKHRNSNNKMHVNGKQVQHTA